MCWESDQDYLNDRNREGEKKNQQRTVSAINALEL